jgi:uroporphyrinogen decarboxylase
VRPRDRLLAAVNGEEIFPVPVDVMENRIYPELESGLRRYYGLAEDDQEGLLVALGAHMRWGKPPYVGPPLEDSLVQPDSSFPYRRATRNIWGSWNGSNTWADMFDRPLLSAETVADVEEHRWPDPDWFDYGRLGLGADALLEDYLPVSDWAERHADYARVVGAFDPVFGRIMDMCGMERGLEHMASRPDLVHAMVAHIGDFLEEYYRRVASECRGHIDFLEFGDDFAGQQGMLLSPRRWREYFLPLWKRLFAVAHEHDMKVLLHACGSIRAVLGDLIDAGLDVFQTVQVTASGMSPEELKREFGADLAFHGGMDTQHILPRGTSDDVRSEARHLIDVMGKGGGYVLSTMHLLMDDVPVDNVVAMYDESRSYQPDWAAGAVH